MMKRFVWLLMLQLMVLGVKAQGVQELEDNPTFKGITIGMPVSELSDKLSYVKSSNGCDLYLLTDSYYHSVFNVKMTQARVIAQNGKVCAIEVIKEVKGSESNPIITNFNELDVIESGLKEKYGEPTHGLSEEGRVVRLGTQWNSKSKQISAFIDFYGTFQGYRLVFAICERRIDF